MTLATLTGSRFWPARGLLINLWNEQVFRMSLREYMLPSLLHAYKASDAVHLRRSSLLKNSMKALVLAFVIALVVQIWLPYANRGGVNLVAHGTYVHAPRLAFRQMSGMLLNPSTFSGRQVAHFVGGALFVMAIMWLRTHSNWLPLHPIGFIVASSGAAHWMWFALFLTWLFKGAIMRWGGYKQYQNLRPFFLGLIVSAYLAGAFWIIVGFAINSPHNYCLLLR